MSTGLLLGSLELTPGFIKRSHLFNSHPSLIQGFDTSCRISHDIRFQLYYTTPSVIAMQTTNNGPGKGHILVNLTAFGEHCGARRVAMTTKLTPWTSLDNIDARLCSAQTGTRLMRKGFTSNWKTLQGRP